MKAVQDFPCLVSRGHGSELPSVLWHCWLGDRKQDSLKWNIPGKEVQFNKNWVSVLSLAYWHCALVAGKEYGQQKFFCWSRHDGVVVASAEPYASYLHFAPEDNHASTSSVRFLRARCPSWYPNNSVKARKAIQTDKRTKKTFYPMSAATQPAMDN